MGTSKLGGEGGGEPSLENNPLTVRDVSNGNPALRREKWKAMSFDDDGEKGRRHKGPSIYYVIQIWGPERPPPPPCNIVINQEDPPPPCSILINFNDPAYVIS